MSGLQPQHPRGPYSSHFTVISCRYYQASLTTAGRTSWHWNILLCQHLLNPLSGFHSWSTSGPCCWLSFLPWLNYITACQVWLRCHLSDCFGWGPTEVNVLYSCESLRLVMRIHGNCVFNCFDRSVRVMCADLWSSWFVEIDFSIMACFFLSIFLGAMNSWSREGFT